METHDHDGLNDILVHFGNLLYTPMHIFFLLIKENDDKLKHMHK